MCVCVLCVCVCVCVCVCCVCVGIASVKKLSTCFQLVVSAATFLNLKPDIENVCMVWFPGRGNSGPGETIPAITQMMMSLKQKFYRKKRINHFLLASVSTKLWRVRVPT